MTWPASIGCLHLYPPRLVTCQVSLRYNSAADAHRPDTGDVQHQKQAAESWITSQLCQHMLYELISKFVSASKIWCLDYWKIDNITMGNCWKWMTDSVMVNVAECVKWDDMKMKWNSEKHMQLDDNLSCRSDIYELHCTACLSCDCIAFVLCYRAAVLFVGNLWTV